MKSKDANYAVERSRRMSSRPLRQYEAQRRDASPSESTRTSFRTTKNELQSKTSGNGLREVHLYSGLLVACVNNEQCRCVRTRMQCAECKLCAVALGPLTGRNVARGWRAPESGGQVVLAESAKAEP